MGNDKNTPSDYKADKWASNGCYFVSVQERCRMNDQIGVSTSPLKLPEPKSSALDLSAHLHICEAFANSLTATSLSVLPLASQRYHSSPFSTLLTLRQPNVIS